MKKSGRELYKPTVTDSTSSTAVPDSRRVDLVSSGTVAGNVVDSTNSKSISASSSDKSKSIGAVSSDKLKLISEDSSDEAAAVLSKARSFLVGIDSRISQLIPSHRRKINDASAQMHAQQTASKLASTQRTTTGQLQSLPLNAAGQNTEPRRPKISFSLSSKLNDIQRPT